MKKDRNNWINAILESTDAIETIEIPETLMHSLKNIPSTYKAQRQQISWTFVWIAAAGILLLFTLNMKTLQEHHANNQQKTSFYSSYYSYLDQLQ